jgi:transcriptional regulator with XRE-family HTH domain
MTTMIDVNLATSEEICQQLGERLRSRRLALLLTQAELAARTGLNIGTVQNVERKGSTPSLGAVVRIAQALGLADHFQKLFVTQPLSIAQMEQAEAAPRQRARRPRQS